MRHFYRSLTTILTAASLVALAGCGEPAAPSPNDKDGDGKVTPADIEDSSVSLYTEGAVDDASVDSEAAVALIGDAVAMTVSDERSMSMLEGAPELPPDIGYRACWDAERIDSSTLEIDFDPCVDHGIAGLVTVTWDGQGHATLAFDDDSFRLHGHDVDGTLHMDRESVHPLEMSVYTADDAPLGVYMADAARRVEISLEGTLTASRTRGEATLIALGETSIWDNADDDTADDEEVFLASNAFVIGGDSAENMGDDPLTWDMPFDECFRASEGTIVSESRVELDEVTIDLDDYVRTGDDAFLPTEFTVQDVVFDGQLSIEYTGECGQTEACFHANDIEATIPLDKENVIEVIGAACENWDRDCDEGLWLLEMFLPDTIHVDVEDHDFCTMAQEAVDEIDA